MKKIKSFKIKLRQREILRILRTTAQITEVTSQLEDAVNQECERLLPLINTAAIYETSAREKFFEASPESAPEHWVAFSVFIVTIGSGIEKEIKAAQQRDEKILEKILHAVALEALGQAGNFVYKLLNEEAKDDSCELLKIQMLGSTASFDKMFEILPGDKIGVSVIDKDKFSPRYSSSGLLYWIPLKKRSSKKKN